MSLYKRHLPDLREEIRGEALKVGGTGKITVEFDFKDAEYQGHQVVVKKPKVRAS